MGEKTKKKGSISYAKWGYIFIAPFFIIFAVFQLIPLASTIYYSFFEYYRSGLKIIGPNFVGLKNYITLFKDSKFYLSLGRTLLYTVCTLPFRVIIPLLVAVLLCSKRVAAKSLTRTMVYILSLIHI